MTKAEILELVTEAVRNQLAIAGNEVDGVGEDSVLLGADAVVDSLGLVNVILEVEQVLQDEHDITITVVDEKAMSLRNSPFRTVGTLTDYTRELVDDAAGRA